MISASMWYWAYSVKVTFAEEMVGETTREQ
jgi:hypothetical protein